MPTNKKIRTDSIGVIYARYSSHAQKDASIEQQIKEGYAHAKSLGIKIKKVYSDRAISGRTDKRPEFQSMMKDAENGGFNYVIAWKSNRMGRNMLQAMINEARLNELGIRVTYIEEDFDDTAAGRFALRSMMNVNQFYSENMAEDIKSGMYDNASKCMVTNGCLPFGFKKGTDMRYAIDAPKDEIVREVFKRVAEGDMFADIIRDINARGFRTIHGNLWNKNSIARMVSNERYRGVYIYGDIRKEGGVPRIVSDNLYYKAQERFKTRKHTKKRIGEQSEYLLTGKLFCGKCKSAMVGISGTSRTGQLHYYYTCNKKRLEKACDKSNIRRESIELAVANAVKDYILCDDILEWIADKTIAYFKNKQKENKSALLEAELAENKKSIKNIMTAIEQGIITETTKSRLLSLEERNKELLHQIQLEKDNIISISKEQLIAGLEIFRDGDITDKKYQSKLFDTFLVAVYVYDDNIKIVFNFTGKNGTTTIPLNSTNLDNIPTDNNNENKCSYKLPPSPPKKLATLDYVLRWQVLFFIFLLKVLSF